MEMEVKYEKRRGKLVKVLYIYDKWLTKSNKPDLVYRPKSMFPFKKI